MKEDFKLFVNNHKELIKYVNADKMTWQKFYDMYELYGENNSIWNEYFETKEDNISNILDKIKNLDPDEVSKNINTITKALAVIGSLFTKDEVKDTYEPMPIYKKFED